MLSYDMYTHNTSFLNNGPILLTYNIQQYVAAHCCYFYVDLNISQNLMLSVPESKLPGKVFSIEKKKVDIRGVLEVFRVFRTFAYELRVLEVFRDFVLRTLPIFLGKSWKTLFDNNGPYHS